MPTFTTYDGIALAYRLVGEGPSLVCLPGGPMQDARYLDDLGGLGSGRQLALLDLRGTGESDAPADPSTYRCDRLVADIEALRMHLGLERFDLLAHSGGANLAILYAAALPERLRRLVLVTPSTFALGLEVTADDRRAAVDSRRGEPWHASAAEAFERIAAGAAEESDWYAIVPFTYGHWDDTARAHHSAQDGHRNDDAAEVYGSEGAYEAPATREAITRSGVRTLVIAGDTDIAGPPRVLAQIADLFTDATFVSMPSAGHFPWLDDPRAFAATVMSFLT